jgi:chromosome segregation ATPase
MDKIKDLLSVLEKKVESNLNELLSIREQNNELLDKNKSLINERNDLMIDLESLEEKFKALKIANTISGSENNINETRSEINSLIREIDLCISQLSE